MRVALISFSQSIDSDFTDFAEEVEKGIIENNHFADLMKRGSVGSVTGYKSIVIGYENQSFKQ